MKVLKYTVPKCELLNDLGRKKYGDSFSISDNWNDSAIEKITRYFLSYEIIDRTLVLPKKGLFICSGHENEAFIINHLLNEYIKRLYKLVENDSYYSRVLSHGQTNLKTISTREIAIESLQSKPYDILKSYSDIQILSLTDFGKESIVTFPNYNKIDVIPEILNMRYQKKFLNSKTVTNIFTNCSPKKLQERYKDRLDVFYHLKSLTDEILLSNPD